MFFILQKTNHIWASYIHKRKNKDNRVLIEYDERTSVSLSYNKKKKRRLFLTISFQ